MPEFAGMALGVDPDDGSYAAFPVCYSSPGYLGVKPGADWFIEGRRYRETARTELDNGYRVTLESADAGQALGFAALEES